MTPDPKFCVECRYHFQGNCRHPSNYKETVDLVMGERRIDYVSWPYCSAQRIGSSETKSAFACGEEGRFWEPIPDDQLNGEDHDEATESARTPGSDFLKGI